MNYSPIQAYTRCRLRKFLRKCCLNITAGLESDVNLKLWKFSKIGSWIRLIIVSKQQKPSMDLGQRKTRFETHLGMVKHADQSKGRAICCLCKTKGHEIWKCEKFKALHTNDRWKIAKDQALYFRCLSNTHKGSSCRRLENVVLMAASQIITVCFTHFGNHRIPLQLQTTPPDFFLLLKKIQLFLVP